MNKKTICPKCNKLCSVMTIGFGVAEHRTIKCPCCKVEHTSVTLLIYDVGVLEETIKKLIMKAQGLQRERILEVIVRLKQEIYKSIPKTELKQRQNALAELQEMKRLHQEVWDEFDDGATLR